MMIFEIYYKIINVKINWIKLYILYIKKIIRIRFKNVKKIFSNNFYKHLNIFIDIIIKY